MKTGAPNGTPPHHTRNIEKQNPTGADITHFKHEKIPAGPPGNQPFFILGLKRTKVFVPFPRSISAWQVKDKLD